MPARFLIAVLSLAAAALPAAPAVAAPDKPFEMTVAPAHEWAGVTDGAYTVTLRNLTKSQQVGSADITAPAAITIVDRNGLAGTGNVLQLRNLGLPPGGSVTVTLGLRMPCVSGAYGWTVEAKQSNDFSGPPGNALGPVSGLRTTTVDGSCKLRFVDQPASAEKNAQIRADAFQPASTHFVTVEAIDGSPSPQRLGWFTGAIRLTSAPAALPSTSSQAIAGLATFTSLSIATSDNYTLHATTIAAGFSAGDSAPFQIVGVVEDCTSTTCRAQLDRVTLSGTGVAGSGFVLLSQNLGADPVCAGYDPPTSDWYEFQVTGVDASKTADVFYDKNAVKKVGGKNALEICFAAPQDFAAKGGTQPFDYNGDGSVEGHVGLLPDCGSTPTPCILERAPASGGAAIVRVFVPASWGDPRMH